jgi:hypothetical protein
METAGYPNLWPGDLKGDQTFSKPLKLSYINLEFQNFLKKSGLRLAALIFEYLKSSSHAQLISSAPSEPPESPSVTNLSHI